MSIREHLDSLQLQERSISINGQDVIVREMTGVQRGEFEQTTVSDTEDGALPPTVRQQLLIRSLYDGDGLIYTGRTALQDVGKLPSSVVDKLFTVAMSINGLSKDKIDEAGNVLDETQTDDSTID